MPKTLRIEHTGEANPLATPTAEGFAVEIIRKKLQGTVFEPVVTESRRWRIGVAGKLQYSDDGGEVWEDADQLPEIPELTARTEATAEDRRCMASANAANVLHEVYEAARAEWNANLDPVTVASEATALIGATIGIFFVAPWAALFAFGALLFDQVLQGLTGLLTGSWSEGDTDRLKCVLYAFSTDTAGIVTFDYDSVRAALPDTIQNGGAQGFLDYIMQVIGKEGLERAGTTTAVTSATCTCGCSGRPDLVFDAATAVFGGAPGYDQLNVGIDDTTFGYPVFKCAKNTNSITGTIRLFQANPPCRIDWIEVDFYWLSNGVGNTNFIINRSAFILDSQFTAYGSQQNAAPTEPRGVWFRRRFYFTQTFDATAFRVDFGVSHVGVDPAENGWWNNIRIHYKD